MGRRNKTIKQESEGNRVSSSGEPQETGLHDCTLAIKSPLLLETAPVHLGREPHHHTFSKHSSSPRAHRNARGLFFPLNDQFRFTDPQKLGPHREPLRQAL